MNASWFFVINPVSGKSAGLACWQKVQPLLVAAEIDFKFAISEYHTHTILLVADAYKSGIRNFMGIGGDGTINEIVNGIYHDSQNASPDLCTINLLAVGTGNDWVRGQRKKLSVQNLVGRIKEHKKSVEHIGVVTLNNHSQKRFFINVAGAGIDGQVVREIEKLSKAGKGGRLVYIQGLLKALLNFKPFQLDLKLDKNQVNIGESYTAIAALGKYFGGGMIINPAHDIRENALRFTLVNKSNKLKILWHISRLFTGTIEKAPFVIVKSGEQLKLKSKTNVPVQADGEYFGNATQVEFKILPNAIEVLD